jgi:hypothetical protein
VFASSAFAQPALVSISIEPAHPFVKHRDGEKGLNFDFAVRNDGKESERLHEIEVQVLDASGRLALKKTVNSDGLRPGMELVAPSLLAPGKLRSIQSVLLSISRCFP